MITFKKKTNCEQTNIPIAYFIEPKEDTRKILYYTECKCPNNEAFKEFHTEAEIFPIPFFVKNQRIGPICICSLSGGGKSTYAAKLINEILHLDNKRVVIDEDTEEPIIVPIEKPKHSKKNKSSGSSESQPSGPLDLQGIYLITSSTESDPAYSLFPPIRLDIQDAMNKAIIEDFANSLVIFDDHTNQPSKELDLWTNSLKNQLLERSRKLRTHLIICNHQQRKGQKTALENIESQAFVVFYKSNKNETRKLLKNYLDFSTKQIDDLLSIDDGRFSTAYINRNPSYIITKHRIYFY